MAKTVLADVSSYVKQGEYTGQIEDSYFEGGGNGEARWVVVPRTTAVSHRLSTD